jgi:L-rhamnose mutarotase
MTERRGFVLRVKPDRIEEYLEAHRSVWPELLLDERVPEGGPPPLEEVFRLD